MEAGASYIGNSRRPLRRRVAAVAGEERTREMILDPFPGLFPPTWWKKPMAPAVAHEAAGKKRLKNVILGEVIDCEEVRGGKKRRYSEMETIGP